MSSDTSPPGGYRPPLQAAASIPSSIADVGRKNSSSPLRSCGLADAASMWDETRSVSSSVRSIRRRRGGEVSGAGAAEGRDWTQAFMDLEQMRRENQELLHGSLRGDRSETGTLLDDTFAGSRSESSAISSVRRRRRGMAAGVSASGSRLVSGVSFEKSLSGAPVVAESVTDTAEAEASAAAPASAGEANSRNHGSTSGAAEERLTSSPPPTTYLSADADTQSRSTLPEPGHTSGLPDWLKRPTVEERRASMAKALTNASAAAPTEATEATETTKRGEVSVCAPASSPVCSLIIDAPVKKLNEAACPSSLATKSSTHANPPIRHFASPMQKARADPARAGAPSPSRGSCSRMVAANSSATAPTSNASSPSPTTAAATLVVGAAAACPTRCASPSFSAASQRLAQTYMARQTKATAVGIVPSSSSGGNARFSPTPVRAAVSPVLTASPDPPAAPTAAKAAYTPSKHSAEVPAAVPPAVKPAKEKPRASASCVLARVSFEAKSGSPELRPQLLPAEVEAGRPTTMELKAPAPSMTATVAEPPSLCNALEAPNAPVYRKQTALHDRAASAVRTLRGAGQPNALSRLAAEDVTRSGEKSRTAPRVAASVPRQRKCSFVDRLSREGTAFGPSQPKGGAAPLTGAVGLLNRTTVLTELRRQEVMRDRLAREHKTAEEARARLAVLKQAEVSRINASGAHAVEAESSVRAVTGSAEARSSSPQDTSQHVSKDRRRSLAVTQPRMPHKRVALTSPSLTAAAVPANGLRACTQHPSHVGAPRSSEVVGAAPSKIHRTNTSVTLLLSASTPKGDRGHCLRGERPKSSPSLTGAEAFAHLRKPLESTVLLGTQPHLLSAAVRKDAAAAANANSRNPATNGGVWREQHWPNIMFAPPQPSSAETGKVSSAPAKKAWPQPDATALIGPVAATTVSLAQPAPYRTAPSLATTGQLRPLPFCAECGYRHMDDVAKFCTVCGQRRAYLCC
ncbi:conserved hypothetical protein [Leishmania major strain Friedlin]|uniref:Uncharacterized protein n=1 Tax=Leishmania major TaxID=5664 RepID=Q4Q4Q3_LEIMA|nr:conserved hypothetical protein [Leishmania major strain Friedlin]CAG9580519.1 hypothetical_protein_-_conserved [Leishmania major strain Friedlin]CAJ08900.1 conserved hypothetical protein [Leishmania major strain Friedlin]|eukprot:XP_001685695.1 conserved hypothetical protein [Leishmania major strain Friedlin]